MSCSDLPPRRLRWAAAVISRLSQLTRLDCGLQAERLSYKTGLPPEPATDKGLRCLSSLQTLQDVTLKFSRSCDSHFTVRGQALSTIGACTS